MSAAPEEWKALPLTTGWKSVVEISGGSLQPVQYRKDAFGRVELRGMATYAAGNPANVPIFGTLPAGYRPQAIRAFVVASGGDSPNPNLVNGPAGVNINPDGTLHRMYAVTNLEQDFLALDGIRFEVD